MKKYAIEGEPQEEMIVWGTRVDAKTMTITMPTEKVEGTVAFLQRTDLRPGNTKMQFKVIQTVRGLAQWWLPCFPILNPLMASVDELLKIRDSIPENRKRPMTNRER